MIDVADLAALIAGMAPLLQPGVFVFASIPTGQMIPAGLRPLMVFREAEGATLILSAEDAAEAGLCGVFPSRLITLSIVSSLEAVGFLARVTGHLAAAGIPVNPVSAFHHDHLFVPAARAEEALSLLRGMAGQG